MYPASTVSSHLIECMTDHVRHHHGWVLEVSVGEVPADCSAEVPEVRSGGDEIVKVVAESDVVRMNQR